MTKPRVHLRKKPAEPASTALAAVEMNMLVRLGEDVQGGLPLQPSRNSRTFAGLVARGLAREDIRISPRGNPLRFGVITDAGLRLLNPPREKR